jgi:transposase
MVEKSMSETLFPLPEKQPIPPQMAKGKPRLEEANRQQVVIHLASLDELLPAEHRARLVWEMVQGFDLSGFYDQIDAVEGEAGRPAIDPRLLLAVWLFATLEGVGSARALERLCQEQLGYQWLLGGVSVNYHTLADFRVKHEKKLDQLLTDSVAALIKEGLVDLERTAQDGIRIRANAGSSSFRREESLQACLCEAQERIEKLKGEIPGEEKKEASQRQQAARQRSAREKVERLKQSLKELEEIKAKKAKSYDRKRKEKPARASTTDPEARNTKMADGGVRPAYNGQLNVDMGSRIIVGVELSSESDAHLMQPMLEQTQQRYGQLMQEHYADGGFRSNDNIITANQKGVTLFTPIPKESNNKHSTKRPEEILPSDCAEVAQWKARMVTQAAKEKYQDRAATVEWANALLRNRGLYRLLVRGIQKARAVLLWFVLAHNLMQVVNLRRNSQPIAA